MRNNKSKKDVGAVKSKSKVSGNSRFHVEFKNSSQNLAWSAFEQHDILFMSGIAGCGKTYLAMAFAINEILSKNKNKIILTRPIVESGEHLGFLPGDFQEKVNPYMMPLYDSINKLVGSNNPQREMIDKSIEIAPLAYLRGRTFDNAICILDEAQNTTMTQMKLFLTRIGNNSKMIINGDPTQSDLPYNKSSLKEVMNKLQNVPGISILEFDTTCVVRNPIISKLLKNLDEES